MSHYDPEEPAPTAILQCRACAAHIAFYGDDDTEYGDTYTLGDCERAVCRCGAVYSEDDTLAVVSEDDTTPARDYDNLETWE